MQPLLFGIQGFISLAVKNSSLNNPPAFAVGGDCFRLIGLKLGQSFIGCPLLDISNDVVEKPVKRQSRDQSQREDQNDAREEIKQDPAQALIDNRLINILALLLFSQQLPEFLAFVFVRTRRLLKLHQLLGGVILGRSAD